MKRIEHLLTESKTFEIINWIVIALCALFVVNMFLQCAAKLA